MERTLTGRSVAAALIAAALLTSCGRDERKVAVVSLKDYADMPRCWFGDGEDLKAFLVTSDMGSEAVPWFISARCIAKGDLPSYGAATLYLLGNPRVTDPRRLLRSAVPKMAPDNVRTDVPLPSSSSPIYYVVARLAPLPDHPHWYEIEDVKRVATTGVAFGRFLEMGPTQRTELLSHVS